MPIVSVRVPEDIKKKMNELSWINWSEVLRKAIIETINQEKSHNIAKAVLITEKLRRKAPAGWNSIEEIRKWRMRNQKNETHSH